MAIKYLPRVNYEIRSQRVKLVNKNGDVLGEFHIKEAMYKARESGLDLVEVAPNARPPVCKLMDFGKYVYEKKRQERASHKHQHRTSTRGMRMSLKISEHDYQVKLAKIKEFLMDGDRVKVQLRLRGREMLHADLGMKVMERLIADLENLGKPEQNPIMEYNIIHVTFLPEKRR